MQLQDILVAINGVEAKLEDKVLVDVEDLVSLKDHIEDLRESNGLMRSKNQLLNVEIKRLKNDLELALNMREYKPLDEYV